MTAAVRLLLSLFVCLAFLGQAGSALSASGECAEGSAMATGTVAATADCLPADASQHALMGKPCKAATVCSPTMPVLQADSSLPDSQYQRFRYPHLPSHFILQDFPRTLLRPPSLG